MPAYAHDTIPPAASRPADVGMVRLSQRDIDGPLARTTKIMARLLSLLRSAQVVYLTAPADRPVVTRAAASIPPGNQARIVLRELAAALMEAAP